MLNKLLKNVSTIYIACGPTDFRKQIPSLSQLVENEFELDPYTGTAYIFCNKRKNSIKVLCYDRKTCIFKQFMLYLKQQKTINKEG